jgi:alkanesulfonate monooxygenase SsuD/methylene tetrahydromethanopterin reductase-like flavin-dependent oxidoreductase (luciferase family)
MWIGVKTPLHHVPWQAVQDAWKTADSCDLLASAWVFDHVAAVWGDRTGSCIEAWTALAALSAVTTRIRVGTMCSPIALRHPFLLAQMASTVQQVSGGRLSLGVGSGSKAWELSGLGLSPRSSADRAQQLAEGLMLIRHALSTEGPFHHAGRFYECHMPNGALRTLAELPEPELVVGGRSDRILRVAAAQADHWNFPVGTPADYCQARDTMAGYAMEIGRPIPSSSAHIVWEGFSSQWLLSELRAWSATDVSGVIVALPAPWPSGAVNQLADVASRL